MPKITISGVHPAIDGEAILDFNEAFDGDELHLIKQHAGVRVGEIGEAMTAGDYDLIVALAKIAFDRAGRDIPLDRLMKAKVGAIQFEATSEEKAADEEEAQLPPASAPTGANETTSVTATSGVSSSNGLEGRPESVLPGIGVPD